MSDSASQNVNGLFARISAFLAACADVARETHAMRMKYGRQFDE